MTRPSPGAGDDGSAVSHSGCTVTLVAAVAANGVIGRDGGLPWHLPDDLRHLKRLTRGHVLVMGRRTYDSIGRPLPERTTIVVTRQPDWRAEGVLTADGVPEALARGAEIDDQVFVLGGEEIFRLALPVADAMVISEVDARPDGDTVFPPVDWAAWREVSREPYDGFEVVTYTHRDSADTPTAGAPEHAQW
jgi:dihydrofolate reductase